MKTFLRDHPFLFAGGLGSLILIVVSVLSIIYGQHYYYLIYHPEASIHDIQVHQLTEDGEEIHLIKQTSIEELEDRTILHFDAESPGSGYLNIAYTKQTSDGRTEKAEIQTKLIVSKTKIIFIGEGVYNHNGISVFYDGISVYSLLMILYCIWRRRNLLENKRYSYQYISTWSSQIFFIILFLTYAITTTASILLFKEVDVYIMAAVTRYLMLFMTAITFPLVFIFAVSMTISNISLIRHEGKRFNNMLGIMIGIGLMIMIAVIIFLFVLFILFGDNNIAIAVLYSSVNSLYIVFFSALAGAIISGLLAGYHNPSMDKDYIIILGCAIRKDGTLYPLIRGRVDRAIKFWKEQKEKTGKEAIFVPSGGKGNDEIISEGEAMKRYLLQEGIEEKYIMPEMKSENTFQNMKFSKELIESVNPSAKIAFSSTNYHVMRSGILASKAGLITEGMGAPTKWYFWPNALLREVVGMYAYQPKKQLLTMIMLALMGGLAGYLYSIIM